MTTSFKYSTTRIHSWWTFEHNSLSKCNIHIFFFQIWNNWWTLTTNEMTMALNCVNRCKVFRVTFFLTLVGEWTETIINLAFGINDKTFVITFEVHRFSENIFMTIFCCSIFILMFFKHCYWTHFEPYFTMCWKCH